MCLTSQAETTEAGDFEDLLWFEVPSAQRESSAAAPVLKVALKSERSVPVDSSQASACSPRTEDGHQTSR